MVWVRILVPVQFFSNEQNFDLFPGIVQGIAGKSDLADLAVVAAVDCDRTGGYVADHFDRMGHGYGVQFDPALCVFFIRRLGNRALLALSHFLPKIFL